MIVYHIAITPADGYVAKREPYRREHIGRLQGLRANGLLLSGEKLLWGARLQRLPPLLQHLYAGAAILLGWVFFRVEDFSTMARWSAALVGVYGPGDLSLLNALGVLHLWPWFLVAALACTPGPRQMLERQAACRWAGMIQVSGTALLFVWSTIALVIGGFNPFIYFRF